MRKSWAFFKAAWQEILEYRADMFVYSLSIVITPLVGLALWISVSQSGAQLSFTQSELVIYFLLVIIVNVITSTWGAYFIGEEIITGTFSKYLVKPYGLVNTYSMNNLSEKVFKLIILLPTVTILAYILLKDQLFNFNPSVLLVFSFLLSLVLAVIIATLIDFLIGLSTFWLHDLEFFRKVFGVLDEFFSGKIVPLILLPGVLYQVSAYLPFRYTLSFPIEIITGKVSGLDLYFGFGLQIIWTILLLIFYKLVYRAGIKLYQGYGG